MNNNIDPPKNSFITYRSVYTTHTQKKYLTSHKAPDRTRPSAITTITPLHHSHVRTLVGASEEDPSRRRSKSDSILVENNSNSNSSKNEGEKKRESRELSGLDLDLEVKWEPRRKFAINLVDAEKFEALNHSKSPRLEIKRNPVLTESTLMKTNDQISPFNTNNSSNPINLNNLTNTNPNLTNTNPNLNTNPNPNTNANTIESNPMSLPLLKLPWETELFTKVFPGIPKNEREKTIAELFTTEQSYIKDLLIIQHIWLSPLLKEKQPFKIKPSQISLIFSNLEQIITTNMNFLESLGDFIDKYTEDSQIGETLYKIMPFFQTYGQYVTDYDNAIYTFENIMQQPAAFKWFTHIKHNEPLCKNLPFDAFLIKPVQRIPRYKLFIDRLTKCTPKENPDYEKLLTALQKCDNIAHVINSAKEKQIQREKMSKIAESLDCGTELLMVPGRSFVKQGQLQKITRKSKLQIRDLFLFTDVLIIAPPPLPGTRQYIQMKLQLKGSQIRDLFDDQSDNQFNHRFQFLSHPKSLEFVAETKEMKKEWIEALILTIKEADKSIGTTSYKALMVYQKDAEVRRCPLCKEKFTTIFRRHHCRQCCRVVCGNCTKQRRKLPGIDGDRKKRICDDCTQKSPDWRPVGFTLHNSSDSEDF